MSATRTRLSLLYVCTYLYISGVGLLVAPDLTQRLLFANRIYEAPPMRFAGLFVCGLGAIVTQIVRLRLDALYPTLIGVRLGFCIVYVALYAATANPFFLSVLGVVGLGLIASSAGWVLDRRAGR